jgi:triacylglycerol lipase
MHGSPTIPVLLVHGLCGFDRLWAHRRPAPDYFPGIATHLRTQGYEVHFPRLSPTASIATRAWELKAYLDRELPQQRVDIIGHSLGGLDSRYLISKLDLADRVRSLTTIGTPHRGSAFADWAVTKYARYLRPLMARLGLVDGAFFDLMTEHCSRFNDDVPNAPGVQYRSVAGVCEKPMLAAAWWVPARIVASAEGPNDGIVSLTSATWGTRTSVWACDHLNLVNWPNRHAVKRGLWQDRGDAYASLLRSLD